MNLIFNEMNLETKKSFLNILSNELILLCEKGVLPIFLTINLPYKVNINDEKEIQNCVNTIKNTILTSLLIYIIIVAEENKDHKIHFHCLLGLRNLFKENHVIEENIKQQFHDTFPDVWINVIKHKKNIFSKVFYLFKNNLIFDYPSNKDYGFLVFMFSNKLFNTNFGNFSKIYDIAFSNSLEWRIYFSNFPETSKKIELLETTSLFVDLIDDIITCFIVYLKYNDLYLTFDNDKIYKKVDDLLISYEEIGQLNDLINNFDKVYDCLKDIDPLQCNNINIYDFKLRYFNKIDDMFEKLKNTYEQKIVFDYSIIELKDCIINIATEQKIVKSEKNKALFDFFKKDKIGTLKFKNILYKNIKKPTKWIEMLLKVLDNDVNSLSIINKFIKNIFISIESKKKVLYIYGKSNTYKTTLLAKPLIEYFGEENIGYLSNNSNFTFQDIENKKFLLLDEFKYEKKHKKDYLKLFEGRSLLVEKKYKKATKEKIKSILILTNNKLDLNLENDPEILKAIQNRSDVLEFQELKMNDKLPIYSISEFQDFIKKNNIEIII